MVRVTGFIVAMIVALNLSLSIFAIDTSKFPKQPQLYAEAAVLMNADTGQVLFGKNAKQQMYPASLTKIMTCLLAMERNNYDDIVTVRKEALQGVAGTTHIVLSEGEQLTMEQLLYAVMLESANDAASAVGIHLAGSVTMFSELMNRRAQELGAEGTHFVNANGLPDDNHYSTAYDLALITSEALKHPEFRKFAGTHQYKVPATNKFGERTVTHRNYMFVLNDTYDGAFAGKTGWTQEAGKCLMTVAERDGVTLVAVVLKSSGVVDAEFVDSTALFDYGFDHFRKLKVPWTTFPSQQIAYAGKDGTKHQGRLYPASAQSGDITVLLAEGVDDNDLTPSTFLPHPLTEENIGRIRYELKLPEVASEVQERIVATFPVDVRPLDIQAEIGVPVPDKMPFPWKLLLKVLAICILILLLLLLGALQVLRRLTRIYYRSFFNTRHWTTSPESSDLYFLQNHAPSKQDWVQFQKQYRKQKRFFGVSLQDIAVLMEARRKAKRRQMKRPSQNTTPKPPPKQTDWDLPAPADNRSSRHERTSSRPKRSNRPFD